MAFPLSAAAVLVVCVAILRSAAYRAHPDVMAWAVTIDLTVTIPLLYAMLGRRATLFRTATLFAICCTIAAFVLPKNAQQTLGDLRRVAGPLAEIVVVGGILYRLARMRHAEDEDGDAHAKIAAAARAMFGEGRVSEVVASELTMLYYALFCWTKKRDREDGSAFTLHERSGWGTVLACILVMIAAEGVGMHLLIALKYPAAAWAWTALDVWAALWLLGDYHALRLRPSRVTAETFELRYGMRWTASIPLDNVSSVRPIEPESGWKDRGILKVAMLDAPRWLVELREPARVEGLAGMSRTVRAIAVLPDDDRAIEDLAARIAGRATT